MVPNSAADRPSNARERRKLETRAEIVEAGVRVFRKRGYPGVTVDLIAKEAGVSRATFYRHFADKDELSIEIGTDVIPDLQARLKKMATAQDRAQVRAVIGEVYQVLKRAGAFFEIGFRSSVSSTSFVNKDMELREDVVSFFHANLDQMSKPDRQRARARIILLYEQMLYCFYESLIRERPLSTDELLEGMTDIWTDELERQKTAITASAKR